MAEINSNCIECHQLAGLNIQLIKVAFASNAKRWVWPKYEYRKILAYGLTIVPGQGDIITGQVDKITNSLNP